MSNTSAFLSPAQSFGWGVASQSAGSLVGALGSTFQDFLLGERQAQRQWRYKQKEMNLQQQYALEQMAKQAEIQLHHDQALFDYQNDYNDPSKVFERYMKAGINPSAVLGQSGVGVSATVPTGSSSAPSGGHPSASSYSSPAALSSSPVDATSMMIADSTAKRNEAAAERDSAEATRIQNETHESGWQKRMDDLAEQIAQHGVTSAEQQAELYKANAILASNDAWLSTITSGYKLETAQAQLAVLKEQYDQLKTQNHWFARQVEANWLLTEAMTQYYRDAASAAKASANLSGQQARLTSTQVTEASNWLRLNWDAKLDIPLTNEKGEVQTVLHLTPAECHAYMTGQSIQSNTIDKLYKDYATDNERHRVRNSIAVGLSSALGFAVGSGVGRALGSQLAPTAGKTSRPSGSAETIWRSDRNGEFIGGTSIERKFFY